MRISTNATQREGYGPKPEQIGERLSADPYLAMGVWDEGANRTDIKTLKLETQHGTEADQDDHPNSTQTRDRDQMALEPTHRTSQHQPPRSIASDDTIETPDPDTTPQPPSEDVTPDLTFIKVNTT